MKKSVATVWKELTRMAKENKSVNVAVKKIKKITGLGESTIREATKDLANEGIIKKIHTFVPDRRTGNRKQVQNEYKIIVPFCNAKSGGGDGSRSGGVKILSLKDLKDQKIKTEEEKNSPVHIQPDKPVQKTHAPLPTSSKVSLDLFQALSSNYQAPVLEYVRQAFEVRYQQGLIGVPSKWIPAALANEQAKYDRTGRVGFPDRKSRRHHKSKRPQVTIAEDHNEQMAQERLLEIMEKAAAYEKDRQKRAV